MRRIGLIGGISWISTVDYYTHINKGVNADAQAMVLCANTMHLIEGRRQGKLPVPIFDTAMIHSEVAVKFMLAGR